MKKIDLRQPKYVLPLVMLPFLCLFFYAWRSSVKKPQQEQKEVAGLNASVGNVSTDVRKKELMDKLDAYRNTYKEADGVTAVNVIPKEQSTNPSFHNDYSAAQKWRIDSLKNAMKLSAPTPENVNRLSGPVSGQDLEVKQAIAMLNRRQHSRADPGQRTAGTPASPDPMEVFKQQMSIMDSITKQNDPAYQEQQRKKSQAEELVRRKASQLKLPVVKESMPDGDFNTILPERAAPFISAVIDENITGYAGSRLRLRLLEDIRAGNELVPKGTSLYAQISGFSEQRVTLTVTTILYRDKILPVKLDLYDLDGLPGLYVPASAFRDFTKDLGANSVQGVTIDGSSGNSQFIMSSLSKMFQSTSSAIADMIRKNKAKLKYNSFVYLIDPDALHNEQKNY